VYFIVEKCFWSKNAQRFVKEDNQTANEYLKDAVM